MRYIVLLLLFTAAVEVAPCQEIITREFDTKGIETITLDFDFADEIIIEGWDSHKVDLSIEVNINDNEDNDLFLFEDEQDEASLSLKTSLRSDGKMKEDEMICLKKDEKTGHYHHYSNRYEMEINYRLHVPSGIHLNLSTINGDVELRGFDGACTLESISGSLDIALSQKENVTFNIETITGGIYTDLDLTYEDGKDDLMMIAGREIRANLNRGGREMLLETISGDIFLRKE